MGTGIDMVPYEDVISIAMEKGLDAEKVKQAVEELTKKGDVYSPRHHFLKPTANKMS